MSTNNIRILSEPISYQELKSISCDVKISGIYKIENLIDHKVYIGQSKNVIKRIRKGHVHLYTNLHLKNAIKKYGIDNFSFEVIKETYDLNYWEIFLIQIYHATDPKYGYNISKGGQNFGNLGEQWKQSLLLAMSSEEYHQKLREAQQRRWSDENARKQCSETSKQRWEDPEVRRKHIESAKGRKCSNETKKKIGARNHKIMLDKHLHWYTNGIKDVCCSECPEGFWLGKSKTIKGIKKKPMSEEQKQYYRDKYTGVVWWNNGINEIRSRTQPKGYVRGKLPKANKPHWFTNGKENIKAEKCPEGYYLGRTIPKRKEKTYFYTNGVTNVRCKECPQGFRPGMTSRKPFTEEHKKKLSEAKRNIKRQTDNIISYDFR